MSEPKELEEKMPRRDDVVLCRDSKLATENLVIREKMIDNHIS